MTIENTNKFITDYIKVSLWVFKANHNVTLSGNIVLISNIMPLFFAIYRDMKFTTVKDI